MSAADYLKSDPLLNLYKKHDMYITAWKHIHDMNMKIIANMMKVDMPSDPYKLDIFKVYERQLDDLIECLYSMYKIKSEDDITVHELLLDSGGEYPMDEVRYRKPLTV